MLTSERTEFDEHFGVLCAGFNVPATPERKDAYWRGLGRMRLHAFIRTVDFALADAGLEKIPTAPQLWRLYRSQQRAQIPASSVQHRVGADASPRRDRFEIIGNAALFRVIVERDGASQASLIEMVIARRRLVADFRQMAAEDSSPTDEQMRDHFATAFDRLFQPRPVEEIASDMQTFHRAGRVRSFTSEELARISA